MNIEEASQILFLMRLVSTALILLVIAFQIRLFFLKATIREWLTRITFFLLALTVLVGNFVPITIDFNTFNGDVMRSSKVLNDIGMLYAFSNAATSMFFSLFMFLGYFFPFITGARIRIDKSKENV